MLALKAIVSPPASTVAPTRHVSSSSRRTTQPGLVMPDAPSSSSPSRASVTTANLSLPMAGVFASCAKSLACAALAMGVAVGCGAPSNDHGTTSSGDPSETAEPGTILAGFREVPIPPLSRFDFEGLVELIERNDVRRLEQLLPLLPEDLRSDVALMATSLSLQSGATLEVPRVILYGNDARLVLAYAGEASQPRGYELEVIQYRGATRSFEFRNISFSPQGEKPVVSEANPSLCLSCHGGDDPRPNWAPYSSWPGAVGPDTDFLTPEQRDIATSLAELQRTNERYQPLIRLSESYREPAPDMFPVEHNGNLSGRLSRWNFERVTRLVQATPDYEKHKYAILGSVLCVSAFQNSFDRFFVDRGIDTTPWYMTIDKTHDFTTPSVNGFAFELAFALTQADPALKPFVVTSNRGTAIIDEVFTFETATLADPSSCAGALRPLP